MLTPICGKPVNLVEGLTEEEVIAYQEANPYFVPLFESDVLGLLSSLPQPTPQLEPPEGTKSLSCNVADELEMATTTIRAELAE